MFGIRLSEFSLERIESALPESLHAAKPIIDFRKARRIEPIDSTLSLYTGLHEMRLLEHLEMLGYCWSADLEPVCDLSGRQFAFGQHFDNPLAGGICNGRNAQHFLIMKYVLN
jgi:hypothetical protein